MARGETPGRGTSKPSKSGAIFSALLVLLLLGAGIAGGGFLFAKHRLTASGPLTSDGAPRIVTIPRGASVAAMAARLEGIGAIRDDMHFRLAARWYDATTRMKAGEFEIPSGASLKDIVNILSEGKSILYPVTIPEGLTTQMVLDLLADVEVLTGELPSTPPPEGALLPDTYLIHRGETREALIARMTKASQEALDAAWERRQADLPFDTKEEALILASIVEKETGLAEERPRVAAVFVNRMKRPMRLQTDPTIIYGVCRLHPDRCDNGRLIDSEGKQRGIRQSELRMQTGYNTYRIDGLPPTPICNPGREAIEAVLNPPETNEYYFVADGSGGHAFASTLREHERNVQNWRRIERNGRN